MFIGEYQHSIDSKGRMAIPAKFRRGLEGGVIVSKGIDQCLSIHPKEEWVKFADRISKPTIDQANSRAYKRHTLGGAIDVEFDAQGRILISEYLRSYAGIKEKAVVVGLYNYMEVWDEEKWKTHKSEIEKNGDKIAENLGNIL